MVDEGFSLDVGHAAAEDDVGAGLEAGCDAECRLGSIGRGLGRRPVTDLVCWPRGCGMVHLAFHHLMIYVRLIESKLFPSYVEASRRVTGGYDRKSRCEIRYTSGCPCSLPLKSEIRWSVDAPLIMEILV